MLRDRIVNLTTPEEVQAFLSEHPTSVIFKAGTCHKTMQGFGFVQERLEPREDLMVGIVRVIEARPASNLVTERTGIRHESPQVILFQDGQPVFEANNWDITPEALAVGFERLPASDAAVATTSGGSNSDLRPYLDLLERYLNGDIDDAEFEHAYVFTFREDASLRGKEEVEILNSIFGDVDQHVNMHLMMAGKRNDEQLRARAESAYQNLKRLIERTPAAV